MQATEHINAIYRTAVTYSRESRDCVREHLAGLQFDRPAGVWREMIGQRKTGSATKTLKVAGQAIVNLASETHVKHVRAAVKDLLTAVNNLAEFVPTYYRMRNTIPAAIRARMACGDGEFVTWEPTAESVAELDRLRNVVRVRLIELDSLFMSYPDQLARVMDVAKRIAGFVLEPTAAKLVGEWLVKIDER
jgi:hypothetical protein